MSGRRLAAIMFVDIAGFTSLSQRNEKLSLEMLEEFRNLVRPLFSKHHGREIKTMGDAILAEFGSALEATRCAFAIQQSIHELNEGMPGEKRFLTRIGIHLGDVLLSEGDIHGDAVNIASRIDALAEPGGICLTAQVYDQIRNKFEFPIASLGSQVLKNVQHPIEIYTIVLPWQRTEERLESLDRRRIVVLPLTNMISGSGDEYFADGMTEELISTLSNISELRVISRTSAMKFKGGGKTAAEIGRELRAGTLLEGSVRKSANRIRITIQLIDSADDRYLWTQSYDRELEDVFAIQSEIAKKVAEALRVKILPPAMEHVEKVPTRNPDAHILYMKGRHHWFERSEDAITKAVKCFEDAVSVDPQYALAFLGLADCYSVLGVFGYRQPSLVYPKAKEFALKGLELDDSLAEGHASMGEILMHYYHDWARAEVELEHALRLNPNYAMGHVWRSTCYAALGDLENAIIAARRATEVDPFSVVVMNELSKNLYYARRFDASISEFQHSLEVEPNSAYLHKGLAETYAQKSMFKESIMEAEKAVSISKSPLILSSAGYAYAVSGETPKAREILSVLNDLSSSRFVPSFGRAMIYAGLGEKTASLDWLEKAFEERAFLIWLKTEPIFEGLRDEGRFQALLKKMGVLRARS